MKTRAAHAALARNVVDTHLGREWSIESLGGNGHTFSVTHSTKPLTVAEAFELSRRLSAAKDVRFAEPSLTEEGWAPPPSEEAEFDRLEPAPARLGPRRSGPSGEPLTGSDDPLWSLRVTSVEQAWRLEPPPGGFRYGSGIRVGHPDTGFTEHPQIAGDRLLKSHGYDFVDKDPNARDPLDARFAGHGTSTSSVIMSGDDRALPKFVTGVAPAADLVPIRATRSVIIFNFKRLTRAINYAVEEGCHVISISLGGPFRSRALQAAIEDAVRRDVVVLAAAGNVWPWVVYPARYPEVVAVAACNAEREVWRKSARGSAVDLTAPGESVWRAEVDDGYRISRSSGTSYAVAMTAGACALWLAYHGRDRLIETYGIGNIAKVFRSVLVHSGIDGPGDWGTSGPPRWNEEKHGAGILNVEKLLSAALPHRSTASARWTAGLSRDRADPFAGLRAFFPSLDEASTARRMPGVFGAETSRQLNALEPYIDEIEFHVAFDPGLRERLRSIFGDAGEIDETSLKKAFEGVAVSPSLALKLGLGGKDGSAR